MENINKIVINCNAWIQIKEFRDTDSSGFANIWIIIPKSLFERLQEVVDNLLNAKTAHGTDSKGTNQRITIVRVLFMSVADTLTNVLTARITSSG